MRLLFTWGALPVIGICMLSSILSAQEQGGSASDEAAYVLRTRAVLIPTIDGLSLPGTLSVPTSMKGRRGPAVLLIPGSGPTNRDGNQPPNLLPDLLKKVAFALAKSGIATLRFDKRGLDGKLPRDPDRLADYVRWENFVGDARAAYRCLQDQPEVDGKRVAIFGHSEGAMLALEATAQLRRDGAEPAALVLAAAPGRKMDVILRSQLAALGQRQGGGEAAANALAEVDRAIKAIRETGKVPPDLAANIAPLFPAYLGLFFRSWFAVDMRDLARRYHGPVLLLNGTADHQVSATIDAPLLDAALAKRPGDDHELSLVAGASHNFKLVSSEDAPGIEGHLAPAASLKLRKWLSARLMQASEIPPDEEMQKQQ